MEQSATKRSSLFLLELIVSILFFALASAVCVQVYVGSSVKSREASDLNQAVLACQSAAEVFYNAMDADNGPFAHITETHPAYSGDGNTLSAYFDEAWQPCTQEAAVFRLTLLLAESSTELFLEGTVQICSLTNNTVIYSLPVARQLS